jgi:replicative DNA helicase
MIIASEYEDAILGIILQVDREEQQKIFSQLTPNHFSEPMYGEYFKLMNKMFNEGKAVDIVGVPEEARKYDWFNMQDIIELVSGVGSCSNWGFYANELERKHLSREMQRIAFDFAQEAQQSRPEDALAFIRKALENLNMQDEMQSLQEAINEDINQPPAERVLFSDIAMLDSTVTIAYQHLSLIAARPSVGKTTLMCNLAMRTPEDKKVMMFSMEQPRHEIIDIMTACKVKEPIAEVASRRPQYWKKIKNNNIFINDRIKKIEKLELEIINGRPDLVLIDNLQCFDLTREKTKKAEVLQDYCYRLKSIAKDYKCAVILLCQLNRNYELTEREPVMSDIRDSGGAEMAADVILALYEVGNHDKQTWMKVMKNRTGSKDISFQLQYYKSCGHIS